MNRILLMICSLLPTQSYADTGLGAEGFWLLLLNSWLLAGVFFITVVFTFFKFFNSRTRRNLFIGINAIPLLVTLGASYIMLRDGAELSNVWWLIAGMLLGHIGSFAMPVAQYKLLRSDA